MKKYDYKNGNCKCLMNSKSLICVGAIFLNKHLVWFYMGRFDDFKVSQIVISLFSF